MGRTRCKLEIEEQSIIRRLFGTWLGRTRYEEAEREIHVIQPVDWDAKNNPWKDEDFLRTEVVGRTLYMGTQWYVNYAGE